MKKLILIFGLITAAAPTWADGPQVVNVQASPSGMGWNFDVTLNHPDTGWDHFADGWEIISEAGDVLGYRQLHHPHVDEQPFTRALNNVMLPDGTRRVFVRVHCSRDGWKAERFEVNLSR